MTAQRKRQPPGSVRYVRGLLQVQAWCWCVVSALCLVGVMEDLFRGPARGAAGLALGAAAAAAVAAGKFWLVAGLSADIAGARRTAIGAEAAMACFGILGLQAIDPSGGIGADFLVLPFLGGAGLSLAAALVLLLPPARRHFGPQASDSSARHNGSAPEDAGSSAGGRAQCVIYAS